MSRVKIIVTWKVRKRVIVEIMSYIESTKMCVLPPQSRQSNRRSSSVEAHMFLLYVSEESLPLFKVNTDSTGLVETFLSYS